jgi:hypothetical protein
MPRYNPGRTVMKFKVEIIRVERRSHLFEVEAEDRMHAVSEAMRQAGDHDFASAKVESADYVPVLVEVADAG